MGAPGYIKWAVVFLQLTVHTVDTGLGVPHTNCEAHVLPEKHQILSLAHIDVNILGLVPLL